jgi:hypothetical protein
MADAGAATAAAPAIEPVSKPPGAPAREATEPSAHQQKPEKPYRPGDTVYLDDGREYEITRIGRDDVTLQAQGLNSGFIIAFRSLGIEDFERQLRGNVFNLEILNRPAAAEPKNGPANAPDADEKAKKTRQEPMSLDDLKNLLATMKGQRHDNERRSLARGMIPIEDAHLNEYISGIERQIKLARQEEAAKLSAENAAAENAAKPEETPAYPETTGQPPLFRAFYDAFGQDAKIANDLREAIQNTAQPDFRENIIKQRRIKAAISQVFQTHAAENPAASTERAFDIFLGQSESAAGTAPIVQPAGNGRGEPAKENDAREPVTLVGTTLGPGGKTFEITLPSDEEIIARHEAGRGEEAHYPATGISEPQPSYYATAAPSAPPKADFRITDDSLGHGGQKAKYKNNAEAIRTLKKIEGENRLATPEEQETLSRYVSWGSIPQVFDNRNVQWSAEREELSALLTQEEYTAARATTINAFYTSPTVIKAMYDGLSNMGFTKGNILEPSCGTGNFFGLLPEDMRESKLYGVELDSISGRIARQLYQTADIEIKGFEETKRPKNFFEAAIGNVPFGNYKVYDREYAQHKFNIHDYFFAKALDQVRPGGVVAFVTSKGTMDKNNPSVRKYLAERAELLGAVRLPNNAFLRNAGTEVTANIIDLFGN